jgi:hypothetical protein
VSNLQEENKWEKDKFFFNVAWPRICLLATIPHTWNDKLSALIQKL